MLTGPVLRGRSLFFHVTDLIYNETAHGALVQRTQGKIMALYMIHWKLPRDRKMEAFSNFSQMTIADDEADSGNVQQIGRWHDAAGEQGWAICDSPTVTDIQAWLFNWGDLISSTITPVQDDAELRAMINAKQG
jgi:hypothetical protein